jgi:hypothetical protein
LKFSSALRITDKRNGAAGGSTRPGTVVDMPFLFAVPCATTSDTTVGSTCSVNTSANTLVENAALEGRRAIWQLDDVEVYDGGFDGDPSTDPNTLFETEGVFIP